jgi:multidrug resistance protein, MATE family
VSLPMPSPIVKDIFRLAWPIFIAQIAVMANGVVDTVMAGRYGTVDLAGVGIGASVYITLFVTLMGVLFALTPTAAQLYGARRYAEIGEEVRQTAWLGIWLAALSLVLLTHPGPVIALSQLAPEVEDSVRAYLSFIAWGVPAALLFRVFQAFSTAVSRPAPVMALNLVGLALKVPLNWIFMYGTLGLPPLGGAGCALATSVIAWLTCGLAWLWCALQPGYRRYGVFAQWTWPKLGAQWQLVSLGVPIGATFFVDVTAFTLMALFVARFGALWSAAHQIAANLAAMCFMLPLAVGNASSVLVGQALGARNAGRARATSMTALAIGLGAGIAVSGAIYIFAGEIVRLYASDPAVQGAAIGLLALVAVYHVFDAVQAVAANVVRGYRRAAVPMLIYGAALWGVGLGGGYVFGASDTDLRVVGLSPPMGASGFWLGATFGIALAALLMTVYLFFLGRTRSL